MNTPSPDMHILEELGGGVADHSSGKTDVPNVRLVHWIRNGLPDILQEWEMLLIGSSVIVALENMPPAVNAHMVTADEIRSVLDEYSWLSFTWDYAHACLAGDPFSFPRECGERIVNSPHRAVGSKISMHSPLAGTPEAAELEERIRRACLRRISVEHEACSACSAMIQKGVKNKITTARLVLLAQKEIILERDPYKPLERGYALVWKEGTLVRSVKNIAKDDHLSLKLADGEITSIVESIK